jgi:hypothetical protein
LFGADGLIAGGTAVDVQISAALQNVAAVFVDINVGAGAVAVTDVGYVTALGGGAILTGAAIKSLFSGNDIGAYPTNENPSSWNNVRYTERGKPDMYDMNDMNEKINERIFNSSPTALDYIKWIMIGTGGVEMGYRWAMDVWPKNPTPAPTTTDKTLQINPKR